MALVVERTIHEQQAMTLLELLSDINRFFIDAEDDEGKEAFAEQLRGILMSIDVLKLTKYVREYAVYECALEFSGYIELTEG